MTSGTMYLFNHLSLDFWFYGQDVMGFLFYSTEYNFNYVNYIRERNSDSPNKLAYYLFVYVSPIHQGFFPNILIGSNKIYISPFDHIDIGAFNFLNGGVFGNFLSCYNDAVNLFTFMFVSTSSPKLQFTSLSYLKSFSSMDEY